MSEEQKTPPSELSQSVQDRKPGSLKWNILSAILLLATLVVTVFYCILAFAPEMIGPNTPFAGLIPPTQSATISIADLSPTLPILETKDNPQASITPTPDMGTPQPPTITPMLATPGDPASKPSLTPTYNSPYPFITQTPPTAVDGTLYNRLHHCSWAGVAGQVIDINGSPAVGIPVRLVGVYNGKYLDMTTLTGTASIYGPSGYEFTLGDQPKATYEVLWLQLTEQNSIPLSERLYLTTSADCDKNLLIINFVQVRY